MVKEALKNNRDVFRHNFAPYHAPSIAHLFSRYQTYARPQKWIKDYIIGFAIFLKTPAS
jgi:hypothetical protein